MIPGSANSLLLASAAAGGYEIERSLRFNSSDSAYASRVFSSAGNRKTWTWAGWVKKASNGNSLNAIFAASTPAYYDGLTFGYNNSDTLALNFSNSAGNGNDYGPVFETTQVFRDPSAWYHIVLSVDTTQATAANRVKVYVNGSQITAFSTTNYPAQNYETNDFNTAQIHYIAAAGGLFAGRYFSGLLADIWFVDSQALTPSAFGEFDATTGVWNPKAYSGPALTGNSFHLDFADNSAATAAALGKDTSGAGNNWTPNNLSVTAGAGNDSLVDSPTNYGTDDGLGGSVRGNYCTLNPLDKNASATLTNGNLDFYNSAASHYLVRSTFGIASGKWYWEATIPSNASSAANFCAGICRSTHTLASYVGAESSGWGLLGNGNTQNGPGTTYTSALALGDVIGIAFDADNGKIWWSKNGTYPNSGNPATGANAPYSNVTVGSGPYFPAVSAYQSAAILNAGSRPFAYTAPSGFKALCTANLPTPTIEDGSTVMDVKLYTGNGSTQTISGLNFSPDFVWVKQRDSTNTASHVLVDIVRGNNNVLRTNGTDAENSANIDPALYDGITNLSTSSFDVVKGSSGTYNGTNGSSKTYAAWCWDAGSSTVTNTQGSITSQVRANASAGFSVVTYTGTATTGSQTPTVGHGLNVAPKLVITKRRDGASDWVVQTDLIPQNYLLYLNSTAAQTSISGSGVSNIPLPTSSVFTAAYITGLGVSGHTHVAYCFAPVVGYSSFGSYTGNGSADGPFIYTGFRPKFILVKNTSVSGAWEIYDSVRNPYNVMALTLLPNASDAEITASNGVRIDFTSNGFKWRDSGSSINGNGNTIIWAAFAESPFAYARAR